MPAESAPIVRGGRLISLWRRTSLIKERLFNARCFGTRSDCISCSECISNEDQARDIRPVRAFARRARCLFRAPFVASFALDCLTDAAAAFDHQVRYERQARACLIRSQAPRSRDKP